MPWERRRYRKNKVWVRVDARGRPVLDERSLAALRYKPDDDRTYTVRPDEIAAVEAERSSAAPAAAPAAETDGPTSQPTAAQASDSSIEIYVRGSGTSEAGAAGLGVVLCWRDRRREIQRYLSKTTEQEAQLAAVLAALEAVHKPSLRVTVFTESCLGREGLPTHPAPPDGPALMEQIWRQAQRFETLKFLPTPSESRESARAERLASDAMHSCRAG